MAKDLFELIKDKLATGYDPVTVNVSARAINEENLEVTIEGKGPYSIKGNTISYIGGQAARAGAEEAPTNTPAREGAGEQVVADQSGEQAPVSEEEKQHQYRVANAAAVIGATNVTPTDTTGTYNWLNSNNEVIFTGTVEDVEGAISANSNSSQTGEASTAA